MDKAKTVPMQQAFSQFASNGNDGMSYGASQGGGKPYGVSQGGGTPHGVPLSSGAQNWSNVSPEAAKFAGNSSNYSNHEGLEYREDGVEDDVKSYENVFEKSEIEFNQWLQEELKKVIQEIPNSRPLTETNTVGNKWCPKFPDCTNCKNSHHPTTFLDDKKVTKNERRQKRELLRHVYFQAWAIAYGHEPEWKSKAMESPVAEIRDLVSKYKQIKGKRDKQRKEIEERKEIEKLKKIKIEDRKKSTKKKVENVKRGITDIENKIEFVISIQKNLDLKEIAVPEDLSNLGDWLKGKLFETKLESIKTQASEVVKILKKRLEDLKGLKEVLLKMEDIIENGHGEVQDVQFSWCEDFLDDASRDELLKKSKFVYELFSYISIKSAEEMNKSKRQKCKQFENRWKEGIDEMLKCDLEGDFSRVEDYPRCPVCRVPKEKLDKHCLQCQQKLYCSENCRDFDWYRLNHAEVCDVKSVKDSLLSSLDDENGSLVEKIGGVDLPSEPNELNDRYMDPDKLTPDERENEQKYAQIIEENEFEVTRKEGMHEHVSVPSNSSYDESQLFSRYDKWCKEMAADEGYDGEKCNYVKCGKLGAFILCEICGHMCMECFKKHQRGPRTWRHNALFFCLHCKVLKKLKSCKVCLQSDDLFDNKDRMCNGSFLCEECQALVHENIDHGDIYDACILTLARLSSSNTDFLPKMTPSSPIFEVDQSIASTSAQLVDSLTNFDEFEKSLNSDDLRRLYWCRCIELNYLVANPLLVRCLTVLWNGNTGLKFCDVCNDSHKFESVKKACLLPYAKDDISLKNLKDSNVKDSHDLKTSVDAGTLSKIYSSLHDTVKNEPLNDATSQALHWIREYMRNKPAHKLAMYSQEYQIIFKKSREACLTLINGIKGLEFNGEFNKGWLDTKILCCEKKVTGTHELESKFLEYVIRTCKNITNSELNELLRSDFMNKSLTIVLNNAVEAFRKITDFEGRKYDTFTM